LFVSAALYAERLMRVSGNNIADIITFARCYSLSGEHRRCLAILEQKGLLSASIIRSLSDSLRPTAVSNLQDLKDLREIGCAAAIVGKAIYENRISLEELSKF
jgi:hypothetical protein